MQPRHLPAQRGEARARQLRTTLEIQPQRRAEIGMVLRRKVEVAHRAPAVHLYIVGFAVALRHIVGGQVGDRRQHRAQRFAHFAILRLQRGRAFLDRGNLGLQRFGLLRILGCHGLADQLARFVAAGLPYLQLGLDRPALLVQRQYLGGQRSGSTPDQASVKSSGIFADETDVVHGPVLCRRATGHATLSAADR
jgi:hypothetical protein